MSEIPKTEPTTSEIRHNPSFQTVVVGARDKDPGEKFRKGELYTEQDSGFPMLRFLELSESGASTGMVVTTRNAADEKRRFFIMRGAPKGVMAGPRQISLTDVSKSVRQSSFATIVRNLEDVSGLWVTVGQELASGTGPVESVLLDTGELVVLSDIDTNSQGQPLHAQLLRDTQAAMKQVEMNQPSPLGH